jgi:type II secretory pathway pseudopilin PulG
LLVALGIFAAVAASLAAAFRGGLAAWRRTEQEADRRQQARAVLDGMARELRNAFPFPGAALSGRADELTVHTVKDDAVVRITYATVRREGSFQLERTEKRLGSGDPARTWTLPVQAVFEYAYDGTETDKRPLWKPSWKPSDDMPPGVRVRLLFPAEGGAEAFGRTLGLPLGEWTSWKN